MPRERPPLRKIGAVGPHDILAETELLPPSLILRNLGVSVCADGANGLTRATPARARELGLFVPQGADSIPLAAYHPDDWGKRSEWEPAGRKPRGLDAPENGGKRIFGEDDEVHYRAAGFLLDEHGQPYVQMPGSAAPGYYLSPTALADERYRETDPRRWFDSAGAPGFVLPGRDLAALGVHLGDFARVTYGPYSVWVQAYDSGNAGHMLELSVYACSALGIPDCARGGGVQDGVDIQIFPGSRNFVTKPGLLAADEIATMGHAAAAAVGLETGD